MYVYLILVWRSDLGLLLVHVDPTYRSYFLFLIRFRSFRVKILIMAKKYRIFALMKKLSDRGKADVWAISTLSAIYPCIYLLSICFEFLFFFVLFIFDIPFRHAGAH